MPFVALRNRSYYHGFKIGFDIVVIAQCQDKALLPGQDVLLLYLPLLVHEMGAYNPEVIL